MIPPRFRWRLAILLVLALLPLSTGAGFLGLPRMVQAQGTMPPRPTLNATQRPLTVEPIETIRATLSATAVQATSTRQATATPRPPTRTVTQTQTAAPSPSRTAPVAATATQPSAAAPATQVSASSTATLSRPTLTPRPTPPRVPVAGGDNASTPPWTSIFALGLGFAMLCFVAGVHVGLGSTRRSGS